MHKNIKYIILYFHKRCTVCLLVDDVIIDMSPLRTFLSSQKMVDVTDCEQIQKRMLLGDVVPEKLEW